MTLFRPGGGKITREVGRPVARLVFQMNRKKGDFFFNTVRKRRLEMKLSQAGLARRIGISSVAVCRMEHGKNVTLRTAVLTAMFFGVKVEELFMLLEEP